MGARRLTVMLVLLVAVTVPGVSALAGVLGSSARKPHPAARRAAIVAGVIGLSGRQLFVKRGGRLVRLRLGGRVALGELVVLGPSTKAKFRMSLPRNAGIKPTTFVMYIARFHQLPRPRANQINKQFGVIAYGVRTHHTVRLEPHYIEFAP